MGASLWQTIGSLSARHAISIAIGSAAPMIVLWFLAPTVETIATALGAAPTAGWTTRWFGIIPYPDPFTRRAALAVGLIAMVPLVFLGLWGLARRTRRSPGTGTR